MEALSYEALAKEIEDKLQAEQMLVLATCAGNKVTARMMCHINDGLDILFSTGRRSEKVAQMKENPNIALAIGNIKVEAVAELLRKLRAASGRKYRFPQA